MEIFLTILIFVVIAGVVESNDMSGASKLTVAIFGIFAVVAIHAISLVVVK